MARPKRTKTEREQALARVAELDCMGWSERRIAKELGVSGPQVHYDLQVIKKRYARAMLGSRCELVNRKRAELAQLRREAKEGFDRSRQDAEEVSEETAIKSGKVLKRVVVRKSQAGDPEFLEVIRKALADERALLGLDAPQESDVRVNAVGWQVLLNQSPDGAPPELVVLPAPDKVIPASPHASQQSHPARDQLGPPVNQQLSPPARDQQGDDE